MKRIIALISFLFFLNDNCIFSQSQSNIESFIKYSAPLILERAHSNSSMESHIVTITDSDISEFDRKVVLVIHYKGFFMKHNVKCYIYFNDGPKKFIWGKDTNVFPINTKDEQMLEELKEVYSIWLEEIEK